MLKVDLDYMYTPQKTSSLVKINTSVSLLNLKHLNTKLCYYAINHKNVFNTVSSHHLCILAKTVTQVSQVKLTIVEFNLMCTCANV